MPVHPKWNGIGLQETGQALEEYVGGGPLRLIHAHGNLIWADDDTAYKLTEKSNRRQAQVSLDVANTLLRAFESFPTVRPTVTTVQDIHLEDDDWILTTWEYRQLRHFEPSHSDTECYYSLGQLLSLVHSLRLTSLPRHDPFLWAESRVNQLIRRGEGDGLSAELALLRLRREELFDLSHDVVLHGDVHWHQTALDESGSLVLLDFEHAAMGHPSVDLQPSAGWLKRTGVPTEQQMAAFREGYGPAWREPTPAQRVLNADIAAFSQRTWQLLNG